MIDKGDIKDLISALSENETPEEAMLSSLQAIIAAAITVKRQQLGLSQKDLAEAAGVSQALVSKWESGETNFTLKTLVLIASKLDLEMRVPFKVKAPLVYSGDPYKVIEFPERNTWETHTSSLNDSYISVFDQLKEN